MAVRKRGTGSLYWSDAQQRFVGAITTSRAGTKHRECFYGPRGDASPDAERGVSTQMDAYLARNGAAGSRATLGTHVERYLRAAPIRGKTRHWYEGLYQRHVAGTALARRPLNMVDAKHGREFFALLTAGATTKRGVYALLRRVCQVALEHDELTINPFAAVKKPAKSRSRERPVWSPEEALAFLRLARRDRLYALYVLALTTTMGPAELFGLQRSSVSLKGGYLVVRNDLVDVGGVIALEETKNPKRLRRITLNPFQVDALRKRFEIALAEGHGSSSYMFTSPKGAPLRQKNFHERKWLPLLDRVSAILARYARRFHNDDAYTFPRIRPYDMRHTANALMAYLGVPIQIASRRMGHASIQQTVDTYGHLYAEADQLVADRLEEFLAPLRGAQTRSSLAQ